MGGNNMPLDYLIEDDYFEVDLEEESNDEELYYDENEDMDKYYDFNLLDLLEDVDLDTQDLSNDELKRYLAKDGK